MAIFAPLVAGHVSPIAQDLAQRLKAPGSAHWFGTDELGRDIYARIVYGSRVTLTIVALVSVDRGADRPRGRDVRRAISAARSTRS